MMGEFAGSRFWGPSANPERELREFEAAKRVRIMPGKVETQPSGISRILLAIGRRLRG